MTLNTVAVFALLLIVTPFIIGVFILLLTAVNIDLPTPPIQYRIQSLFQKTKRKAIDSYSHLDLYSVAVALFYLGTLVLPIVFISIFPIFFEGIESSTIFNNSLTVGINSLSLMFIVVVFLIQNTNQEYVPQLSQKVLKNNYIVFIFAFMLLSSAYNLSALYVSLGPSYQFISYLFSISSIFLIGSLIVFSAYFLNIENTVRYTTEDIVKRINKGNLYKPNPYSSSIPNDDFEKELAEDTYLISLTCKRAIEKDERSIVEPCLKSMNVIGTAYLSESYSDTHNGEFVEELLKQFEEIADTATKNNNESDHLATIISEMGQLAKQLSKEKDLGDPTSSWRRSLYQLSRTAYRNDNEKAMQQAAYQIYTICIVDIHEQNASSSYSHPTYLKKMADFCTDIDESIAATTLQVVLNGYQWIYIAYLNELVSGNYTYTRINPVIDEMEEIFISAKENYSSLNKDIVFQSVFEYNAFPVKLRHYGLVGFTPDIYGLSHLTNHPPQELRITLPSNVNINNPKIQAAFYDYIEQFVGFHKKCIKYESQLNNRSIFDIYPAILFILVNDIGTDTQECRDLVFELTEDFLEMIKYELVIWEITQQRHYSSVVSSFQDYFAISIYHLSSDPDMLSGIFEIVNDFYLDINTRHSNKTISWVYRALKLHGCWIYRYHNISQVLPLLRDLLISDFYEPGPTPGRSISPPASEYGYLTGSGIGRDWSLSTNLMWDLPREKMRDDLNKNLPDQYIEFHNYLKRKKRIQDRLEDNDISMI